MSTVADLSKQHRQQLSDAIYMARNRCVGDEEQTRIQDAQCLEDLPAVLKEACAALSDAGDDNGAIDVFVRWTVLAVYRALGEEWTLLHQWLRLLAEDLRGELEAEPDEVKEWLEEVIRIVA